MSAALSEPSTDHEWLPDHCPSWCEGQHAQVLVELGDSADCWYDAQTHRGLHLEEALLEVRACAGDLVIRPGYVTYHLRPTQQPTQANDVRSLAAVISLQISGGRFSEMHLMPGEARTLARRLLHLADLMELDA